MQRVSDYFVEHLAGLGTNVAFMVSGGQMMHLIDAVGRHQAFRYYCNHHEQAAAMAADAYARVSGVPGLCYATGGPGGANTITGLIGAYQDSIPIVFLTGQCKVDDTLRGSGLIGLRQKGTFEIDILPIVSSVTKYAAFVDRPEDARYHMEKATHLALTGRPGPVLLDVPLDVQGAMIDPSKLRGFEIPAPVAVDSTATIAALLQRLSHSRAPLIFAGHGVRCAGSIPEFHALVNLLGIPVVTTQLGKDLLHYDHPQFIGHPGIKGNRAANFAVQQSDCILVLGSSLHLQNVGWDVSQFASRAHKLHVDPDQHILDKTRGYVTEQLLCDTKLFIEKLLAALSGRGFSKSVEVDGWCKRCCSWKTRYSSAKEPHQHESLDGSANLYEVMDILSDLLPDDAVILTDAGQPTYVVPEGLRLKPRQRFLAPGSLAEMGWAVPAALGAATAAPERTIVAVVGDGSMMTNLQELESISHNHANIKLLVIDNGGYASIRGTQRRFFDSFFVGSTSESGVSLPDWEKIAAAFKFAFVRCGRRKDLREQLTAALATPGPVLCSIAAIVDQDVVPWVASVKTLDGKMKSAPLDQMTPPVDDSEVTT